MKLWRIYYDTKDRGNCIVWRGTQAEAKRVVKNLEVAHGRWNVGDPTSIDVPTDKEGLPGSTPTAPKALPDMLLLIAFVIACAHGEPVIAALIILHYLLSD